MSTAPARVSSSSSQLRIDSWQPSHEANFQTASLGLAGGLGPAGDLAETALRCGATAHTSRSASSGSTRS